MSYQVEILPKAVKEYRIIPDAERENVKKAILSLEKNPRGAQVKKLEGREYYRLRVGDWQAIFAISDKLKKVTLLAIEHHTSSTY